MTNPDKRQPLGRQGQQFFGQMQGGAPHASPAGGFHGPYGQQPFAPLGGPPQQPGQSHGAPGGISGPQYAVGPMFPGQARVIVPGVQIQFPHTGPLVLGTMGSRFLARLIDGFLVTVPVWGLALGLHAILPKPYMWWALWLVIPAQPIAMWLYESMMISVRGATVGKSVAGLRVVTAHSNGQPGSGIGHGPAFTRGATMILPGLVPILGQFVTLLTVLSPFFDEQAKQGWHDKAARTYVISTKPMY